MSTTEPTEAQKADRVRRQKEDFEFLVLCQLKNNMAMYNMLRDRSLDDHKKEIK